MVAFEVSWFHNMFLNISRLLWYSEKAWVVQKMQCGTSLCQVKRVQFKKILILENIERKKKQTE